MCTLCLRLSKDVPTNQQNKMKKKKCDELRTRLHIVILCDLGWPTMLPFVVTSLQLADAVVYTFSYFFFLLLQMCCVTEST